MIDQSHIDSPMQDVWIKLERGAYDNHSPVPRRPKKPHIALESSSVDFCDHATALAEYDEKMVTYREQLAIYYLTSATLAGEFRRDLEMAFQMTTHPKRDLLYNLAWNRGSDQSLRAVAQEYSELVVLLQ